MKSPKQKKGLSWLAGTLVLAMGMYGGQAMADIAGSAHDFSNDLGGNDAWNTSGEICVVCHTPHEGDLTVADAPLWNHDLTAVTTYIPYDSLSLDSAPGTTLSGLSKLCLSCHDGTVALDSYGGTTGTTFIQSIDPLLDKAGGAGNNDLSNDHPIAFTYDGALVTADGGLNPVSTPVTVDGGTSGTIDSELLFAGQMECVSCHNVHNKGNFTKLLRIDNAGSALCLTCHTK